VYLRTGTIPQGVGLELILGPSMLPSSMHPCSFNTLLLSLDIACLAFSFDIWVGRNHNVHVPMVNDHSKVLMCLVKMVLALHVGLY